MVLVVVLIVVAMISLAGFSFAELMLTENKAVHLHGDELQVDACVASGEELVKQFVEQPAGLRAASGGWFDNPLRFRAVALDSTARDAASSAHAGRFSVLSPRDLGEGAGALPRFGLENESAKLNLTAVAHWEARRPGAGLHALRQLPGMTDAVANAILDWLDADSDQRPGGAEAEFYGQLDPPFTPRNGPLETIDELLLVKGVNRRLLWGTDRNVNGMVDEDERAANQDAATGDDVGAAPPRGWASMLTLYSAERNASESGQPRINLNDPNLPALHARLQTSLDEFWADFIVAYRQYGPHNGDEVNDDSKPIPVDLTMPAKCKIVSLLDLVDARVKVPRKGMSDEAILRSPVASEGTDRDDQLARLFDRASVVGARTIRGKVNVNIAPREVLLAVPGLDAPLVDQIIAERRSQEVESSERTHIAWLWTSGLVDLAKLKQLVPYLTAGGDVFRCQVVGFLDHSGPTARAEIVVDGTTTPAGQLYWKDLQPLGRGYSPLSLGADPAQTSRRGASATHASP